MLKSFFSKATLPDYERFAKEAGQQFSQSLQKYNPRVDGIGHGYYFNNFIVVTILDPCMVRFILDRNDVFIEVAPLNTPPITREINTINLWTDVSIITSWLDDKGSTFKWFYKYGENRKIKTQLEKLELDLRTYWDSIIELYSENGFFTKNQAEFLEFRKSRAQITWQELGWDSSKNPQKSHKTVLGHFPQYAEVATDLGTTSSYLGMETKAWKTLWMKQNESLFWPINKQFLIDALEKRQDEIVLATEVRNPESFFAREIKYLVKRLGM
jgi:hypothetical protein